MTASAQGRGDLSGPHSVPGRRRRAGVSGIPGVDVAHPPLGQVKKGFAQHGLAPEDSPAWSHGPQGTASVYHHH